VNMKRSAAGALLAFVVTLLAAGCSGGAKKGNEATPAKAAAMADMGKRTGMGQPKSAVGMRPAMSPAGMPPGGMSPAGMPPGGMPGMRPPR
jgi:hypothetical protein